MQPAETKSGSADTLLQGIDFSWTAFAPRPNALRAGFPNPDSDTPAEGTGSSSEPDGSTPDSRSVGTQIFVTGGNASPESGSASEGETIESHAASQQVATAQPQWKARAAINLPSLQQTAPPSFDTAAPQATAAPVTDATSKEDRGDGQEEGDTDVVNARRMAEAPAEWNLDSDASAAAGSSAPVAFEAKLSVIPPATGEDSHSQTAVKQPTAAPVADPVDNAAPERTVADTKPEILFKTEAVAAGSSGFEPAAPPVRTTQAPATAAPSATHLEPLIEAPSATPSRHAISVNVPDAATESNVNLRFVERGGEIHVSVRSADAELTQDLRGGLSELSRNLEHAGIRTEIAAPVSARETAADSGTQRDPQQAFSEQRGSGRQTADSQREQQDARNNNPSRWKQAYAESAGENSQEQSQ